MSAPIVAVVWERLGEYHHARLERAARDRSLHAIEVAAHDTTYDWVAARPRVGYAVTTLAPGLDVDGAVLKERMDAALARINPCVVAVPGWSAPYALFALDWARRNGRGVVMLSDSNRFDARRRTLVERFKRAVVAHAGAGLAAGTTARDYLGTLGMPSERVALGYDVVDNDHFARPPDPPPPANPGFLAIARFVPRKNLGILLRAYVRYLGGLLDGVPAWPLVLVGDGPERAVLEREAAALGIAAQVTFAGFRDYAELPGFYHRAGAFVLPSLVEQWGLVVNEAMAAGLPVIVSAMAGAAADLVDEGQNGFTFPPNDPDALADHMARVSGDAELARRMGAVSREIVADWGLDRFASGLAQAVALATDAPEQAPRPGVVDRLLLAALLQRVR